MEKNMRDSRRNFPLARGMVRDPHGADDRTFAAALRIQEHASAGGGPGTRFDRRKRRAFARRQERGSNLGRSETCPTGFAVAISKT
jgi:hypothetical protein